MTEKYGPVVNQILGGCLGQPVTFIHQMFVGIDENSIVYLFMDFFIYLLGRIFSGIDVGCLIGDIAR
jgi:hypothetical protein